MKKSLVLLTLLLCATLIGAAEQKAVTYVYLDPATTKELAAELLGKGLKAAVLFDPAKKEWFKALLPTLKGTRPLLFVRGNLTPEETTELKKWLDLFEYDAVVLHAKRTAGDGMGVVPVSELIVIERVEDLVNKWVDFDLTRGAGKPERALLQDKKLDPQDLGAPFTVAGGMIFKRSKLCLVNLDRPGASLPKGMDLTVVFSKNEEKLRGLKP